MGIQRDKTTGEAEAVRTDNNLSQGYQEQCQKILREIMAHKDFGKKNPLDIGMELGYTQKDIFEALSIQEPENAVQEQ